MKCPLSITGELAPDKEFIGAAADCLKEECAWWNKKDLECMLVTIGEALWGIANDTMNIAMKMPKDLAPGR